MEEGPGAGNIVAGLFLILFGLFITLLGGGCTLLMLSEFQSVLTGGGIPFLLVSLLVLGGGLSLLYVGVKLMTGGFRR